MMASLTQQHRYGLKNNHNSNNNTLFHVKLTDSALRSLEAFQNLKGSLPGQPSICFKGNQGYIKIPVSAGGDGADSSSTVRVFSFYLSTDSKDQPQASFDCVHQHVTSDGRDRLEGQGSIQDKITVCATDDSYQMTRERMSQVEKDSWSRSAIEIKPGATHPSKCVKFQKRPGALLSVSDSCVQKHSPTTRRTTPLGSLANQRPLKERIDAPLGPVANHRSLRERIIHLLAVKPYRKAELVLWLEREKATTPKDKADLGSVLDEVARVNVKDGSYVLKEELYKQLQRDRPGYAEEERQLTSSKTDGKEDRQLMGRMLTGKLQVQSSGSSGQSRGVHGNMSIHKVPGESPSVHKVSGESSSHQSTVRNPTMKRPVPSDAQQDSLAAKRQRPANQRLRPQPPPANQPLISQGGRDPATATPTPTPLNPSFLTDTAFQRTSNHAGNQNGVSPPPMHKLSSSPDTPLCVSDSARQGGPTAGAQKRAPPGDSDHRKRKSKKHKDKERERLKNNPGCLESSPDLKHNPDKLDNPNITNCVSSPLQGKPDYLTTYLTITSVEQRQRYQDDFCAEYDEYKDLHSRIATVTQLFVQLGHKIKTLSPGTQEYKILEDQILEKYTKYRKTFPDARSEKRHCQYLHEKLSHIKHLITDYDVLHNAS